MVVSLLEITSIFVIAFSYRDGYVFGYVREFVYSFTCCETTEKFWTDSDVIFRVDYLWADLKRVDFEGRLPRGILDTRTIPFDLE